MNENSHNDIILDDGIKSIVERMNLRKKVVIPLALMRDPVKFLDRVIPVDKPFVIVVPKDNNIEKAIVKIRRNSVRYVLISENIKSYVVVFY